MNTFTSILSFFFVLCSVSAFISHPRIFTNVRQNSLKMMAQKEITMPALSSTMKEGKIISWVKKVGEKVNAGEVLLVVESDKADMDVESFEDGILAAIHTSEGNIAPVGAVVATLVDSADEISKVSAPGSATAPAPAPVAAPASPASPVSSSPAAAKPAFDQILMPALSSTMKEGKIISWSKKVGDKISAGDMVLVVESDKADMDVESFEEGYLAAVLVGDGQVAPVGAPVAYLAKSPEEVASVQAYVASGGSSASVPAPVPAASTQEQSSAPASKSATPAPAIVNDGRVAASGFAKSVAKDANVDLHTVTPSRGDGYIVAKDVASGSASTTSTEHVPAPGSINASPMARKLATENKLDVSKIKGTGNFGRVLPDDVLRAAGKLPIETPKVAAAPSAPAAPKSEAPKDGKSKDSKEVKVLDGIVPMNGMQKAVAKNMEKTLSVPVFRVSREIYTDSFDALYAQLKPKGVTVSAMLAKAVAMVLKDHPIMNAAYVEGGIKYHKDANIAMAVAIDGGLITPTIQKANELDLFSISRSWKDLVDRAKLKKLSPSEYSSGTFTISNLGMFGVQQFDAILPQNMGTILAISAANPKVVQLPNGFFGVKKAMTVTVTCDHRHIYGADAAAFLRDLADLLENKSQSLTMG